jgi:hypothetical protein
MINSFFPIYFLINPYFFDNKFVIFNIKLLTREWEIVKYIFFILKIIISFLFYIKMLFMKKN